MEVKPGYLCPPGYKQTEAGVIPEDWNLRQLGDVVTFFDGRRRPVKDADRAKMRGTIPYYGASGIVDYVNDYLFDEDLILLGEDGENILSRNCRLAFRISGKAWVNNHAHVLKPNPDISIGFLTDYLESLNYERFNSGTAQPKLNKQTCFGIPVTLPPTKAEQEAIAEVLSDADAFIESLEQLLTKKRQLKQGAMQELLTGKKRLPGFESKPGYQQTEVGVIPEDWGLDFIENLAHITTGSRNTQDRVDDGQYPFFVRSQTVERINSYSFDGEAVLTAGDGVGTGKVFHYINGKFDAHQRVYRISEFSERINGYFFYLYFSSHFYGRIMQMTAKSSVDSVRREMIARMLIPLPPTKAEQVAVARILFDMDEEIAALEEKLTKARQLKQGMMQELLTGRVRLV
jgi:type I restriction enzyme, S subunit